MSTLPGKDPALAAIHVSIGFDKRLWREDLDGSVAHVRMLGKRGIITADEARRIEEGLERVRAEIIAGTFPFRDEHEDIAYDYSKKDGVIHSEIVLPADAPEWMLPRNSSGSTWFWTARALGRRMKWEAAQAPFPPGARGCHPNAPLRECARRAARKTGP